MRQNGRRNAHRRRNRQEFEYPTNIKQIGQIEDGMRIYMEDYVHTYLARLANDKGKTEKLGALIGRHTKANGQQILVISGAIAASDTVFVDGNLGFSLKSWDKITEEAEKYFPGLSVVGWVHTQPGYGAFLMARDEVYHRENFPSEHQVLYVLDPTENMDAFFMYENDKKAWATSAWKKDFELHWGRHAVNAIRVLHEYITNTEYLCSLNENE